MPRNRPGCFGICSQPCAPGAPWPGRGDGRTKTFNEQKMESYPPKSCLLYMFTLYVYYIYFFLNHVYHFTFRHCKNTRPYLQMSLGYQVSPAWALERLPYIRVSCQPSPEIRAICQDLARFCWTITDNLNHRSVIGLGGVNKD